MMTAGVSEVVLLILVALFLVLGFLGVRYLLRSGKSRAFEPADQSRHAPHAEPPRDPIRQNDRPPSPPKAAPPQPRPSDTLWNLKVFLCHASEDKEAVRDLYRRLMRSGFVAWLDEENLLPGQDWDYEITQAVRKADVVIVCLSSRSEKRGYVQKEIVRALDVADQMPQGTIFIIPTRLEECSVPERLSRWQWVDLFTEGGYSKLERALKTAADRPST